MELIRYWRGVRRWAWLIILCTVVAALAAGLISLQLPKAYEAQVVLGVTTDTFDAEGWYDTKDVVEVKDAVPLRPTDQYVAAPRSAVILIAPA